MTRNSESVECSVGTVQDITQRKLIEEKLREASFTRSLIEVSLDPLVTINKDGEITDVNTATEFVTGVSREKLIGSDFSNYFTEPEKAKEGCQQVLEKGFVRDYPLTIRHVSGSLTDVLYNATVYKDVAGNIAGVFAAARDITQRKRAEEALRESEYAYHTLAENLPGIVYRVFIRENNRMRFFNKLAKKVTGYGDEELTSGEVCSIENLIVPKDREIVIAEVKRAITKNRSFTVEYRLKHKDGSTRCMLEQGTPIYGKEGQPLYIDGIIFDVTQRKQAEMEREQFFKFFQISNDIMVIADPNGCFKKINPACLHTLGYSEKELLAKPFVDFVHPDDRQSTLDEMARQIQLGFSLKFQNRYLCKDGTMRWLSWSANYDKDEGITYATARDITERKQIEEELRKSEALFRKLVDTEPECVKLLTKENILVDMNPAGLKMIEADSRDQVIGKSVQGIIDPEYQDAFVDLVERVFKGESVVLEFTITGLKGTKRWLETHAVPLRDDNGKINLLISVTRDITEHKHAEEERFAFVAREQAALAEAEAARKLDRMKSMFIASTSHELRTPLNSIIGFTSLILDGISGELNADQKEQLEIVHSSGKHLLALINDIIDLSMIESGRLRVVSSEFNLREIVDEAASNLNVILNEKKLELKVDVRDIKIKSDRTRILQCLINLLGNAIKYTEKGSVEITAKVFDNNVEISVIDTGIGIKAEDIPKLFGPFVRLQSPLTLRTSGTGLGLYLVKKLTKDFLGGDVEVMSELGKGSKFTLRVPVELKGTV